MRLPHRRPLALALAAGLLTAPLTACGGDVEGESGSDGDQTPTAPPTADDGEGDGQTGEQDDP
ncbi:hypothetical protein [Nocardioides caldifontis]|uniref:hypothetical protein n=1 Tax=Nocardioides caldifontis TaxID=2588938 RepID=UPI0011DFFFD6|nr:hypothetical protein [Nocardioides caldifontis]